VSPTRAHRTDRVAHPLAGASRETPGGVPLRAGQRRCRAGRRGAAGL